MSDWGKTAVDFCIFGGVSGVVKCEKPLWKFLLC